MKKVAIKCKSKKHGKKIVKYFEDKGVDVLNYKGNSIGDYYYCSQFGQLYNNVEIPEGYKEIKLPKNKNWVKREIARLAAEVNELKKHPMLNDMVIGETQSLQSQYEICVTDAEIKCLDGIEPTQEEKEIDWSIPGQIFMDINNPEKLVMSNGCDDVLSFEGSVIQQDNNPFRRIGYFKKAWDKQCFKLYTGIVTLKN